MVRLHPDDVANETDGCHQPQVPTTSRLPVLPHAMLPVVSPLGGRVTGWPSPACLLTAVRAERWLSAPGVLGEV